MMKAGVLHFSGLDLYGTEPLVLSIEKSIFWLHFEKQTNK